MDRLEAMSILLSVVETGSLSAAGRKLNVPLATVSRKVSELEAHLGARLFNRSSRRFTPTTIRQARRSGTRSSTGCSAASRRTGGVR